MEKPGKPGSMDDLFMNHAAYAGKVIPDPWDDPNQTGWPMNPEGGGSDGLGVDQEPDEAPN